MNFEAAPELRLFGESVRSAVGEWAPPLEPELGAWLDDRDDALAQRLEEIGWRELWDGNDPGPAVAGGLELGRALAPMCLLDEATLGAPLSIGGRVRHGAGAATCAVPLRGWGLALAPAAGERTAEQTLDGSGTVVVSVEEAVPLSPAAADARWHAWTAATIAYLAGLADAALAATVAHARSREQFGKPLSTLPAVQARLADAAVAVDGLELTAWQAAASDEVQASGLIWSGSACRDVTATAQQIHGAVGFALETGLHRYYRRAKATQVWAAAVCRVATS